ncbi:MAG: type IV toxin-antitoxin system AbiEi family antitoxin domain-containing protein, partial [Thiohalorhabdaceae bacterium]
MDLYSPAKLPSWLTKLDLPYQFVEHRLKLFEQLPEDGLTILPFGHWDWPIRYATWELAFLELIAKVESRRDFDYADKLFEGASVMRPWLIQKLLAACTNVKAKRLFLWFARR